MTLPSSPSRRRLNKHADEPEALLGLASARVAQENFDAAREIYVKLTKIKSDSAEVAYNAGLLEQKAGRHEDAAAYYRKAAELDPQLAEAHLNLAVALQALGKPDEAVGSFEQAIRIKPSLAKGYFALKPMRRNAGQATPV